MDTSTIIGVLVGAAIAVLGSLATVAGGYFAQGRRGRKDNLRRVAARYLTACDQMWSADQAVRMSVATAANLDRRNDLTIEQRQTYADHELSVESKRSGANWNARRIRDELDLLQPKLSTAVLDLYTVSCSGNTGSSGIPSAANENSRADARSAFMTAARRYV